MGNIAETTLANITPRRRHLESPGPIDLQTTTVPIWPVPDDLNGPPIQVEPNKPSRVKIALAHTGIGTMNLSVSQRFARQIHFAHLVAAKTN